MLLYQKERDRVDLLESHLSENKATDVLLLNPQSLLNKYLKNVRKTRQSRIPITLFFLSFHLFI